MRFSSQQLFSFPVLLSFWWILCASVSGWSQTAQYHSYSDTLIIDTHLEKGMGLFTGAAGQSRFMDTTEWKKWEDFPESGFIYPDFLDSLTVTILLTYFSPPKFFDSFNHIQEPTFQDKHDKIILLVKGYINNKEVFIVDQNHNQDLTDDPIRNFSDFNWQNYDGLIRCNFESMLDGKNLQKHGYLNIGFNRGSIWQSTFQHTQADLSIDGKLFKLGVMDRNSSSMYFLFPKLALFGTDGVMKDTLNKREIVSLGEYIFLGDQPYRFDQYYNGSQTLMLVRVNDYEQLIGTQMGLLAPDFKIKTVGGKIIAKSELQDKPLMIVNLTGCNGPGTFKQFDQFYDKFHDDYHIISLQPLIHKDLPGILVDTEEEENQDFYKSYRDAFSSYDVFQIGMDGRIKDVFDISRWKEGMLR